MVFGWFLASAESVLDLSPSAIPVLALSVIPVQGGNLVDLFCRWHLGINAWAPGMVGAFSSI